MNNKLFSFLEKKLPTLNAFSHLRIDLVGREISHRAFASNEFRQSFIVGREMSGLIRLISASANTIACGCHSTTFIFVSSKRYANVLAVPDGSRCSFVNTLGQSLS